MPTSSSRTSRQGARGEARHCGSEHFQRRVFADAGAAGMERQKKLVARKQLDAYRLLGPNSMGVIVPEAGGERERGARDGVAARRQYEHRVAERHDARHYALARRGAGPWVSKLVSVGNEADIGVGELVELLAADAPTRVIVLFSRRCATPRVLHARRARRMRRARRSSPTTAFRRSAKKPRSRIPARSPAPTPRSTPTSATAASCASTC